MKILDLYCCAGGAGMGYHNAGFEVTGIDNRPQKNYPFKFIQADAIEYLNEHHHEYDAFHASPPCQRYSVLTQPENKFNHPDLIGPTREALLLTGKPFLIENVPGARKLLINPVMLCGSMFELSIQRHRYFELSWTSLIMTPPCKHDCQPVLISGVTKRLTDGKRKMPSVAQRKIAIDIDWMVEVELDEAIPPAYTKYLGEILINHLNANNHHQ